MVKVNISILAEVELLSFYFFGDFMSVPQFDGEKIARKKKKNDRNNPKLKFSLFEFRREATIGSLLAGRYFRDFSRIIRYIHSPFEILAYEFSAWDLILSISIYVLFSIVIVIVFVVLAFYLVSAGIVTGISTTNVFAEILGNSQIAQLIFLQTLIHMFIIILFLIVYHAFVLAPNIVVASFKLFAKEVWVEGWRRILWRCLVAPMIAGFFAMLLAWTIFWLFIQVGALGIIVAVFYMIGAIVITVISALLIITSWFSFWRNLHKYLYENVGDSYTASFFLLFATFKGFAVLAGIPVIIKITQLIIGYAMLHSIGIFTELSNTLLGELMYIIAESIWTFSPFNWILFILTGIIVAIALILEIFDLMQLASVFPQLIRKAMLSGLKYAQEYGEPGFMTVIDLKQSSLESMKLVIIYGAGLAYFAFTIVIITYIIPALFNIAIRIF